MLVRLGGIGLVIGLILWLIALAESITADETKVRNLPKMFWIMLILFTFDIGSILWFFLGRPKAQVRPVPGARRARRGPVGPDDDPDFLSTL